MVWINRLLAKTFRLMMMVVVVVNGTGRRGPLEKTKTGRDCSKFLLAAGRAGREPSPAARQVAGPHCRAAPRERPLCWEEGGLLQCSCQAVVKP